MSDWQPSGGPAAARSREAMMRRARDYFIAQDILAVDTPALSQYAVTDANIESLAVSTRNGRKYFLHTSPEFCMKRLLAAGYPDIYSICRVFRDGEAGQLHAPEFTMVEWYRLGFELSQIVDDTTHFIATCLDLPALASSVVRFDFADIFQEFAAIDVTDTSIDELAKCCGADERLRAAIGTDKDAWLDLILATVIAPQFVPDQLTVVQHYPANQAALARLCPDDPRFADRFEVFCGSIELANGYVELTDAAEQRRRMDSDLQKRSDSGQAEPPWDRSLIAALESGLPRCAGVAVGFERLQMIFDGSDDIRDVVTFGNEYTNGKF
jgi:lysyl-tRNA synthetase class 2